MEYDWIFDYKETSTMITMRITVHPPYEGASSWSGYTFNLERTSFANFTAFEVASNTPLEITPVAQAERITVIVSFGGERGDGWAFYVKFLDLGGGINPNKLTDYWDWTSNHRIAYAYHLWLPVGYDVSVILGKNPTRETLEGRVYATFSGITEKNEQVSWTLVAKKIAGQPAYPTATTGITTATAASTSVASTGPATQPLTTYTAISASEAKTTTSPQKGAQGLWLEQGTLLAAIVLAIAIVTSASLILMKKGKGFPRSIGPKATVVRARTNISTGFPDLDHLLVGGLPERYGIVIVSPAYDERDLLLRRMMDSALSANISTFYVSSDIARTEDLLHRYPRDFYAFNPQAEKIVSSPSNLYKIPAVDNLSEFNISFSLTKPMLDVRTKESGRKIIVVDLLSDVLLRHKALTTRKWLSDFIGKRKIEGFTIIATLNPLISKEETQTVVDLFDGIIEIYEKEIRERARRFLVVKKMYGQLYSENELMLDREKLY